MYEPEMRIDCPMRGNLGNCTPVGGFCMDAVSDEICEAVHNAYDYGFFNAVKKLKEQEDLGAELTNAVELIHKKNKRIEELLKEQEACSNAERR